MAPAKQLPVRWFHLALFFIISLPCSNNKLEAQNCLLNEIQIQEQGISSAIFDSTAAIGYYDRVDFYELQINGYWDLVQSIESPDPSIYGFGNLVDIHENYALISAFNVVFVLEYQSSVNQWNIVQQLVHDNSDASANFGNAIKIEGDYAYIASDGDSEILTRLGAVSIFKKDAMGFWVQTQKIYPTIQNDEHRFGSIIDVNNGVLVVSCPGHDGVLANIGAVYIYENNGSNVWVEKQIIENFRAGSISLSEECQFLRG